MPTFEEVMAVVALAEDTVPLCLAGDLATEVAELRRQRAEAPPASNIGERSPASLLDERIAEVAERMRAATVDFKLRAVPGRAWVPFFANRPTRGKDEAAEAFQDRWQVWIFDMVSRTCTDPVMRPEQVGELADQLNGEAWATLSNHCWDLNSGVVEVPNFVNVSPQTPISGETLKLPTEPEPASANGSATSRRKSRATSTTGTVSPAA